MSNSTDTTGCISHKPNCRYFIIYEDFRDIARAASGTEHEYKLAAFWRVLETKTNDRITAIAEIAEDCRKKGIPIPEEHLWIEMSYADFAKRAQGAYKSSSFQVAAAESERLGFSKSRNLKRPRNPTDPESALVDYKEYLFNADAMQTAITTGKLPPPIEINSPLLKAIPERKKKRKEKRAIEKNRESLLKSIAPPIEINTSPLLKSIGNNNIDKDITNNTEEYRESTAPESDAPTVSPIGDSRASSPQSDTHSQQGDAHVDIPSGTRDGAPTLPSADMGDLPASGQDRRLAAPARRPVVPTGQEKIGDNHAVVATHTPGGGDAVGNASHHARQAVRESVHGEVVSKKGQVEGQLANTSTPTPAQAPPPQSEQAASGQATEKRQSAKVEPLAEPDMSGKWSHEKCVEYAEWCNKRRYTDKMREEQMKAAQSIHKNDGALTLEQFKQAYDERNDAWWQEHKGKLHVNDMKAKGASGIDRVHEMLQRIEDAASRQRARAHLQVVSAPPANAFIARSLDKEYNQRKLAEMRAQVALKQAQQIGV